MDHFVLSAKNCGNEESRHEWPDRQAEGSDSGSRRCIDALTGNDRLFEEGKADHAVGEAKEAVQEVVAKVKDAVRKTIGWSHQSGARKWTRSELRLLAIRFAG